jgi:hypothetical protein
MLRYGIEMGRGVAEPNGGAVSEAEEKVMTNREQSVQGHRSGRLISFYGRVQLPDFLQ